jgi:hypothetical protein
MAGLAPAIHVLQQCRKKSMSKSNRECPHRFLPTVSSSVS